MASPALANRPASKIFIQPSGRSALISPLRLQVPSVVLLTVMQVQPPSPSALPDCRMNEYAVVARFLHSDILPLAPSSPSLLTILCTRALAQIYTGRLRRALHDSILRDLSRLSLHTLRYHSFLDPPHPPHSLSLSIIAVFPYPSSQHLLSPSPPK